MSNTPRISKLERLRKWHAAAVADIELCAITLEPMNFTVSIHFENAAMRSVPLLLEMADCVRSMLEENGQHGEGLLGELQSLMDELDGKTEQP